MAATWPPIKVISADKLDSIIRVGLNSKGLLTSNYKYFRGDSNMWAVHPDIAWAIWRWGDAHKIKPSPETTVYDVDGLQKDANGEVEGLISINPDGSVVVRGQTGQCDNTSNVLHSDFINFANTTRIGFDLCAGYLWQYGGSGKGHSPNWIVDENEEFWIMQASKDRSKFLYKPSAPTKIHFIYK